MEILRRLTYACIMMGTKFACCLIRSSDRTSPISFVYNVSSIISTDHFSCPSLVIFARTRRRFDGYPPSLESSLSSRVPRSFWIALSFLSFFLSFFLSVCLSVFFFFYTFSRKVERYGPADRFLQAKSHPRQKKSIVVSSIYPYEFLYRFNLDLSSSCICASSILSCHRYYYTRTRLFEHYSLSVFLRFSVCLCHRIITIVIIGLVIPPFILSILPMLSLDHLFVHRSHRRYHFSISFPWFSFFFYFFF